jgi:serine/threonine-protein kinase
VSTSCVILGDRYELHRRIGAGGYSEVWRATDLVLGRDVAIKLLYAGFAEHAETRTRFRAEGRYAGRLSHENIARVYDFCEPEAPDLPFLVMELIDGPSVADLLRSEPLDQARTARVLAQAAAGLDAAHQAGLIHRDIKPANLLISPAGVVKITDFGISDAADSAPITATNLLIGTVAYLAPERVSGVRATQTTDLYALGIVGYECLTGEKPFDGQGIQVALAHREQPLPPLPASVAPDLAALIRDLTAKDPDARPGSAAEVARRAGQIADRMDAGLSAPAPVTSPDSQTVQDSRTVQDSGTVQDSLTAPMPVAETAPFQPPAWRRPGRRVLIAAAAAALVLIIAGVVAASEIGSPRSSPPHALAGPSASSQPAVTGADAVEVNGKDLIGLPVGLVARQLTQQGLRVRVVWTVNGARTPGTVLAVRPEGRRPSGSLVTVVGASRPPAANQPGVSPTPGNGKGRGNGNGNGGEQGDG